MDSSHYGKIIAGIVCVLLTFLISRSIRRASAERAVSYSVPAPKPCGREWKGQVLGAPSIKVSGSTCIQCYAPATGKLLGLVNPSTPDSIDRAIARATTAQAQWKHSTFAQRRKLLNTLLKFILENQATIIRAACLDSGKTRTDAVFGEILVTAEKLQWTVQHGEKALTAERRPTNLLMFYKQNEVRYEPLGVVAACVSWNYPFHNLIGPIISALFTGNAVIIKNSEQTAWSSVYFSTIVREALKACNFDPDLVHSVSCWPQTADYLTSHPGISHLTFIGSRPVAHDVARSASKSLIPLCIELGGKDAAIILDGPDGHVLGKSEMSRITSIIMRGTFQSTGQNCVGIERIIAMPGAYEVLLQNLLPLVRNLRLGDDLDPENEGNNSVDVGAMISSASFDRLERLVSEAQSQGARLLVGGKRYMHASYQSGHYFMPTLIVDVTPDMRIAQEELFGPVCVMMRAASVEESIQMTNATDFGLGCSVFGPTSSAEARSTLRRVANEVKVGMVAVNDFAAYYVVQLPFGGMGGSGYGRFGGMEGLRALCNPKSVCSDKWPNLIKTAIPAKLDYPMRTGAWNAAQGVVELGYGESIMRRWQGIRRLTGL